MMVKYSSHSTSWSSAAVMGAHITVPFAEPAENVMSVDERGEKSLPAVAAIRERNQTS